VLVPLGIEVRYEGVVSTSYVVFTRWELGCVWWEVDDVFCIKYPPRQAKHCIYRGTEPDLISDRITFPLDLFYTLLETSPLQL